MTTGTRQFPHDTDSIDISKPAPSQAPGAARSSVAAGGKRSHLGMLMECAMLRLAGGRLSFAEYLQLKLFDDDVYTRTDKKVFVGVKAFPKIWRQANFRINQIGVAKNKIASAIWFATHGLPVLPTTALFHEGVGRPGPFLLRSDDELRAFLTTSGNYPLFGKPIDGYQSLGSASVERYNATRDCLVATTGRRISLGSFMEYVKAHAAGGYQFQPRISPHANVRAMCGDRLATVRVLTTVTNGRPHIQRACWKIPTGDHAADNFWRPGNLLAQLDLESGRVLRVIGGAGTDYEEITHHPDSGLCITGTVVPNWHEVTQLALDGAKLLEDLPLVGWDIAPVDAGAVLVEANATPDFRLHQMADRRGMLDPAFSTFLKQRRRDAASARRAIKRMTA